jgi:hypothetical protein
MMRAFRKALPFSFQNAHLLFKKPFYHDGYQREKLNIKNQTRYLCLVKPYMPKYGSGVMKIRSGWMDDLSFDVGVSFLT